MRIPIEGRGDVLARPKGLLRHLGPATQGPLAFFERLEGVGHQAVVGQGHAGGRASPELPERGDGLVQVEIGRRGGGAHDPRVGQADPDGVAGEEDAALAVVQGQMMLGVPGRIDGGEGAARADVDGLAVGQHVEALDRGRGQPAVEGVQEVAVHAGRRTDQAVRIDQVAGPLLVDVHGGPGKGPGHIAHPAGVVEVDVGDGHAGQVAGRHAVLLERGQQGRHRRLAAGLDQDRRRTLDQVPGGHPGPSPQEGVDLPDPRPDVGTHGAYQPSFQRPGWER